MGDPLCLQLSNTCLPPRFVVALSLSPASFGGFGYNAVTGNLCYIGQSDVYVRPNGLSGGRPNVINVDPELPTRSNVNGPISIHFQNSLDSSRRNYVATVVYKLNGHLTLNFLSSPDYDDLEEKISLFIENLLYGEVGGSYITGMSSQQAEEIVNGTDSIPWVLWIILFVMLVSFLLFGDFLSPYHERLIYFGRKALNKKDYAGAIENYNKLATIYPNDLNVKQDILNYLRLLKEKIGHDKINLVFYDKDSLPKIKSNHSMNIFSNYSRVEKMIHHALIDVKKSPKLARSRMPVIVEEYKRLILKDKERLAPHYESLVYKLKNLNTSWNLQSLDWS